MIQRLFKKSKTKQQPEEDKDDQTSNSTDLQVPLDAARQPPVLTDRLHCVSSAAGDRPPVEYIAESITKLGDTHGTDNLGVEMEFPKDAMSLDESSSQTELEDETLNSNSDGPDVAITCASTSSYEFDSLLMPASVTEEGTNVTHDSSSDSSVSETLDDDVVGTSETESLECVPKCSKGKVCDAQGDLKSDIHDRDLTSLQTAESESAERKVNNVIGDSACLDLDNASLKISKVFEGIDFKVFSSSEDNDKVRFPLSPENDTVAKIHTSDDGSANAGISRSAGCAAVEMLDSKVSNPVVSSANLRKCKSESVLIASGGFVDEEISKVASCPCDNLKSVPVVSSATGPDLHKLTSRIIDRAEILSGNSGRPGDTKLNSVKTKSVKPKIKDKPHVRLRSPSSECTDTPLSLCDCDGMVDANDKKCSQQGMELFCVHSCVNSYPCCTHSTCLYNQHGKLCTISDQRYIFAEVRQAPILVSLESADVKEIPLQVCRILWTKDTPVVLSEIEDGTEVMFDAVVLPESKKKYVAVVVWHTYKPDVVSLPIRFSLMFLEEFTGFYVQLVSYSQKKKGLIKAILDGREVDVSFSFEVVFLNGKKVNNTEEMMSLFQLPSSSIYTAVNKFLSLSEASDKYLYMATCVWNDVKPNVFSLQPRLHRGILYGPHSSGLIPREVKRCSKLYCDIPCQLSLKETEGKLSPTGRVSILFNLNFILDNEIRCLSCTSERLYCGNSQVTKVRLPLPSLVKVKAHILKYRMTKNEEKWTIIMVQVPSENVTKTLTQIETISLLGNTVEGGAEKQPNENSSCVSSSGLLPQASFTSFDKVSYGDSNNDVTTACDDTKGLPVSSCDISIGPKNTLGSSGASNLTDLHLCNDLSFSTYSRHSANLCRVSSGDSLSQHPSSSPWLPSLDSLNDVSRALPSSNSLTDVITNRATGVVPFSASGNAVEYSEGLDTAAAAAATAAVLDLSSDSGLGAATAPAVTDSLSLEPQSSTLHSTEVFDGSIPHSNVCDKNHLHPREFPSSASCSEYSDCSSPACEQFYSPRIGSPFFSNSSNASSQISSTKFSSNVSNYDTASLAEMDSKADTEKSKQTAATSRGCSSLGSLSCGSKSIPSVQWSFGMGPIERVSNGSVSSNVRAGHSLNLSSAVDNTAESWSSKARGTVKPIKACGYSSADSKAATSHVVQGVPKFEPFAALTSVTKQKQSQPQKSDSANSTQKSKEPTKKETLYRISCSIHKVSKKSGIAIANGKVFSDNHPKVFFLRRVAFVNGVKVIQGSEGYAKPMIEAQSKQGWTCLLEKCKPESISNEVIHYKACLVWIGNKPLKAYNKLLEKYRIIDVPKSSQKVNQGKPSAGAQGSSSHPTASHLLTNTKPVLKKGIIKSITDTGGTLVTVVTGLKRELAFERHICFLYNVCLQSVPLSGIIQKEMEVEFEEVQGKVKKVYVGNRSAEAGTQDSKACYHYVSAWCHQHGVPLELKEALLLAVGWLPPELGPTAFGESESSVIDVE